MQTLQSSKSLIVCLLIFKVNQDSLGDFILFTAQGVSFNKHKFQSSMLCSNVLLFGITRLRLSREWILKRLYMSPDSHMKMLWSGVVV